MCWTCLPAREASVWSVSRAEHARSRRSPLTIPYRSMLDFIIATSKSLGINNLHLIRGDVFRYLKACSIRYDLIFADPPYALEELPTLPSLIVPALLKPGGLFVLEHGDQYDFSGHPHFLDLRTYGSVHFSFFQ